MTDIQETAVTEEPEVGSDALEKSLDALLAAADAGSVVETLKKGGQVFSGHVDERGSVGGGASPETGAIESLMIGKLTEAGVPAAQAQTLARSMFGAMTEGGLVGKAGFPPKPAASEEEEEEGEGEGEGEEEMSGFAKSFTTPVQEAIDASAFLEEMTSRVGKSMDGFQKSLRKSNNRQDAVNAASARALVEMGRLLKSQARVIQELGKRLNIVERAPVAAPKGITGAVPMQKSLTTGGAQQQPQKLSKSQVAAVASYMRIEKGMSDYGQVAIRAESGGEITQEHLAGIHRFLAANPTEAASALNYK